jgi:hypothetical protein
MRRSWTLVGIGAVAELLALALWAFVGAYRSLFWPFLGLSTVSALAGAWLVLATMLDLTFHRPRGPRLRPVLGAGLFLLALLQLRDALGAPPA